MSVRERIDPLTLPEVKQAHAHAQQMLNGTGRILVRLSGTELLARVMVEDAIPKPFKPRPKTCPRDRTRHRRYHSDSNRTLDVNVQPSGQPKRY